MFEAVNALVILWGMGQEQARALLSKSVIVFVAVLSYGWCLIWTKAALSSFTEEAQSGTRERQEDLVSEVQCLLSRSVKMGCWSVYLCLWLV